MTNMVCGPQLVRDSELVAKISNEDLSAMREKYTDGTRIELTQIGDEGHGLNIGDTGSAIIVDDTGTILVDFDCGISSGIVLGEDACKLIED